ncbi:DEAD/DEAH box helicase family protein [Oxyplasma meridianum]|uniref:DNA 3'-5' helicase n=1 Tax=Oxyplasma meridianum TaxID=3073602 RepID=A0AAX4NEX2_9ARCH
MGMTMDFDRGTILLRNVKDPLNCMIFDPRVNAYRAPAYMYARIASQYPDVEDRVFEKSQKIKFSHSETLRAYQKKAISKWKENGFSGTIVLPTAAGKTHIGIEAIRLLSNSVLVVAPTIELIQQWRTKLEKVFGIKVGQIGGGEKTFLPVTVSTYDSAFLMAETLGNKFKLVIFDEVHHLASDQYLNIAKMFASPYRLGLTATYERTDLLHEKLEEYMGGKIFEMGYEELEDYLADFSIIRIPVELNDEEEEEYRTNREIFLRYIRRERIRLKGPWDFEKFIMRSWNPEGREALLAWRRSREIAFSARVKIDTVRYVLSRHRGEKTIIFTEDTDTAYLISREFLVPALTYLTPGPERKEYLDMFREGKVTVLATSRVLDEGVDVPDATIGIVLSGSGSARQYRQRLGRILRPGSEKKAVLYEIVTKSTSEYATSSRRRKGVPNRSDDS